jgi:hypothetical protein
MSTRVLSVFVALLMSGGSAWTDEATGGVPMQLALSDSLSVGFMVPPSWAAQGGLVQAGQSAQPEMISMNGKHKLKVAVLVPQGKNMPDEMLRKMVEGASSPKLAGSVEDQLNTVEEKTETSLGRPVVRDR